MNFVIVNNYNLLFLLSYKSRDTNNIILGGANSHCTVYERACESKHKKLSVSDLFR